MSRLLQQPFPAGIAEQLLTSLGTNPPETLSIEKDDRFRKAKVTLNLAMADLKCQLAWQIIETYPNVSALARWPSKALSNSQHESMIRSSDGGQYYQGQSKDGAYHGYGLLILRAMSPGELNFYEGQFLNGQKHGHGWNWMSGQLYIGNHRNGKFDDQMGYYRWKDGQQYLGAFVNGVRQGKGRWTHGQALYQGDWRLNSPCGVGIMQSPAISEYSGEVWMGEKHGSGHELFINGDRYSGSYVKGKPQGKGVYSWTNGALYRGQFKSGLREGKGRWQWGQQKYNGQYIQDQRNGFGEYFWSKDEYYKGQFKDDLRHGFGEMWWADGWHYVGSWKCGIQNGTGQMRKGGELVDSGFWTMGKVTMSNLRLPGLNQNVPLNKISNSKPINSKSINSSLHLEQKRRNSLSNQPFTGSFKPRYQSQTDNISLEHFQQANKQSSNPINRSLAQIKQRRISMRMEQQPPFPKQGPVIRAKNYSEHLRDVRRAHRGKVTPSAKQVSIKQSLKERNIVLGTEPQLFQPIVWKNFSEGRNVIK